MIRASRTAEERRLLALVKRLLERYHGDDRFRAVFNAPDCDRRRLAEAYGLGINLREAAPLLADNQKSVLASSNDANPLVQLWTAYRAELEALLPAFLEDGDCADANPAFHLWRRRQIRRTRSELGSLAATITHSVLAFELSSGCSIGCWFCGVAAPRFQSNFTYTPDNARLWRACLENSSDLLGEAVQSGFCYWATEPSDNPDYPAFLEDFWRVVGVLPQTTTAAPLRDLALTRHIMQLRARYGSVADRFSILNLKTLDGVHAAFTAEELFDVELVLQNREAATRPSPTGRANLHPQRLAQRGVVATAAPPIDGATIACVSGFVVNMVAGNIRLISPTRTCEQWPLGYRVFGERRFSTASEFRDAVADLIAEHMPATHPAGKPVKLREDVIYKDQADGFVLEAPGARVALTGFAGASLLGSLLRRGNSVPDDLMGALIASGVDIFVATDVLQQLFDAGLLSQI